MATTTFTTMIPTPSKNPVAKRPGPPVPPRPQQSSLLRTQRDSGAPQRSTSKVGLESTSHVLKKPAPTPLAGTASAGNVSGAAAGGGRTVIYKSPSMNLPKRQEETREKRVGDAPVTSVGIPNLNPPTTKANAITQTTTTAASKLTMNGTQAPKPPLKLRKAPDVPTSKVRTQPTVTETAVTASTATTKIGSENQEVNSVVIVQSSQGAVTLNRHHSMNTPSHNKPPVGNLKDSRLSLGRADFERVGHKINLSQLQPTTQPLPRPRKIVKIPVATLDLDDTNSNCTNNSTSSSNSQGSLSTNATTSTSSSSSTGLAVNLFKRSKTTLDNFTSRSHITTVTTGQTTGSYLSGKTVEIKNNLKNAAERLFSEIMVNQQKHGHGGSTDMHGLANMVITKHERAIQHQTVGMMETGRDHGPAQRNNVTVVTTSNANEDASLQLQDNCTRINITTTAPSPRVDAKPPTQIPTSRSGLMPHPAVQRHAVSAFNSPEKKSAAFHEMLISELAAMRTRSCSMENLQTKTKTQMTHQPQQPPPPQFQLEFSSNQAKTANNEENRTSLTKPQKQQQQDDDHSNPEDDIDADNIEDADGDADDSQDIDNVLKKSLNESSSKNSPRKRTPSGCSSDSSPYGTERSSRIRTSDWIEVGDNGKQVTLTSCHISLEDSGLEDEERMDEMSSSGVGDSWDSVKEAEQQQHHEHQHHQQQHQQAKRSRSVKRIMSINDLPPLPKSLSGINKMLASDSGLISDVDTEMARNAKNNEFKQMESQKENNNNNNANSNNNSNNNNIKDTTTSDKLSNTTASGASTTNTASVSANVTETTTTTPLKELNGNETISEIPPAIPGSKLDNQIATLRKEMFGLRQLDLTLLSQLWALNDSIQEFRTMIQENEQEDDETYSTHSRSPSPYDSVSSDGDDEISALKGKKLMEMQNANTNVITSQPKLTKTYSPENAEQTNNKLSYSRSTSSGDTASSYTDQKTQLIKPPLPKPLDVKPVPRMRSAPPPPPTHRKSQNAPPRPT